MDPNGEVAIKFRATLKVPPDGKLEDLLKAVRMMIVLRNQGFLPLENPFQSVLGREAVFVKNMSLPRNDQPPSP